jgi:hypothetical protein
MAMSKTLTIAFAILGITSASPAHPADAITTALAQCLRPAPDKGQYSSAEGGSALLLLMEQCMQQYYAFLDYCKAHSGTEDSCNNTALAMSRMALKAAGK